jgi:hypothetical protein
MMLWRTVALGLCLASAAPFTQMASAQQQPNCADFHRNTDGSWSPTHTFTASGVTLDPSWHFYPGYMYGNNNVVGILDQRCASAPGR